MNVNAPEYILQIQEEQVFILLRLVRTPSSLPVQELSGNSNGTSWFTGHFLLQTKLVSAQLNSPSTGIKLKNIYTITLNRHNYLHLSVDEHLSKYKKNLIETFFYFYYIFILCIFKCIDYIKMYIFNFIFSLFHN